MSPGDIDRSVGVATTHGSARRSQLQSVAPAECPFSPSECYLVLGSRYSLGLRPLRGQPARPSDLRPPLLYLRFALSPEGLWLNRVLQGIKPAEHGMSCESPSNLLEVSHLV